MSSFSKLVTADLQVVEIDANSAQQPDLLRTRIRYELVGSGKDFHRQQRVGEWGLEWEQNSSRNGFQLRRWEAFDETQSRSAEPVFADISGQALGATASYTSQLAHGVDYWRTVLDGASGIDIYGHNGVSVGDIDGDGFDDLYVCQPAGLPNRLYRNRGDGTFEDITEASGVGLLENTACALFADFDNDGRQDLIVVRASGPLAVPEPGRWQISSEARRVSVRHAAAGNLHRRGGGRLRSRWLAGYLLLSLRLLSGHGSVQVSRLLTTRPRTVRRIS